MSLFSHAITQSTRRSSTLKFIAAPTCQSAVASVRTHRARGGKTVDSVTVELPWPPSALRPNASSPGSWRKKQGAAKSYKAECMILLRPTACWQRFDVVDRAHLHITFCPPDKRRRDLDNMLASFKQGIDAIAEAMGVDDFGFSFTILRGQPVKGGIVRITVTEE